MLEDLRAGEMIIFSGRAYLGLGKEAFKSLFSIMPAPDRVITDDVEALGYHAMILNWPTSTIIAVLVLK